jgi:hypothetical protein
MKKVFIGCSSESLNLAGKAKQILSKKFEVVIWNESAWDNAVFRLNNNFLNDLIRASLKFDFGLLIGTTDDKVDYRGADKLQPRDNVLFELGLFIGRLGLSNCAFVVDKKLDVLTDVQGISLARFEKDNEKSFEEAISSVSQYFDKQFEADINFFPSSTLAAVYFENFVKPTITYLINNGGLEVDNRKFGKYKLKIVIPKKISPDLNLQFEKLKQKFNSRSLSFEYAGRPRTVIIEADIKDAELMILDFPTVLSGINHAILNLMPTDFNQMSDDYNMVLEREVERFIVSLKKMAIHAQFDELIEFSRDDEI